MNVPIKPSDAISAAQPIGRPSFDVFLKTQLAALPADEAVLLPLYAAYRGAAEALQAEFNKPRTTGLAADRLEDEIDRANDYACAIAVKLSRLKSVTKRWRGLYLETMVSHSFFIGGDATTAETAIEMAAALPVREKSSH